MSRWPWVTIVAALVLICNPIGFEILLSAIRYSPTDWLRDLWVQVAAGTAVLIILAACLEWVVRARRAKRRSLVELEQ